MTTHVQNAPDGAASDTRQAIIRRVTQVVGQMAVIGAMLFLAAGKIDWWWAWVYIGTQVVILVFVGLAMIRGGHTDVIVERSKLRSTAKGWDRIIVTLIVLPGFAQYIIAGLDERWNWPGDISLLAHWAALAAFLLGYGLVIWAMMSNPFFATLVAIQRERGHHAITSGPYRFVRHPGYVGMIVGNFATCVVLGSLWSLIPAAAYTALIVVRTALEDRTLQAELPGYPEYAAKTRYRLLPGVW